MSRARRKKSSQLLQQEILQRKIFNFTTDSLKIHTYSKEKGKDLELPMLFWSFGYQLKRRGIERDLSLTITRLYLRGKINDREAFILREHFEDFKDSSVEELLQIISEEIYEYLS